MTAASSFDGGGGGDVGGKAQEGLEGIYIGGGGGKVSDDLYNLLKDNDPPSR